MANVNDKLEFIQNVIWKHTGYKGNNIDILLGDSNLNRYVCGYIEGEERKVPEEYADACYFVWIRPELNITVVREYRPSSLKKVVLM